MKYCDADHPGLRYPDDEVKCRACGKALLDVLPASSLPDGVINLPTLACPNASCRALVAPPKTKFCSMCGVQLEGISYELWLGKFVRPQLEKNLIDVLIDQSVLFPPVGELGLSRAEAIDRLNELLEEKTGIGLQAINSWIEETTLALQHHTKSEAARKNALRRAQNLKIKFGVASAVVEALAVRTNSSEVGAGTSAKDTSHTEDRPTRDLHRAVSGFQEIPADAKKIDQGQSSAKSFYRHLISGGTVSNDLLYLSAEKSASKTGLKDRVDFLKEVANKQGTFILFTDGDKGWLLPNPSVPYRPNALASLFPNLKRDEYDNFRQNIEPVFVVRAGNGRWKVRGNRNGSTGSGTEPLTIDPGSRTTRPHVHFPISAESYLDQVRQIAMVVRPDFQKGILVGAPTGNGELVLIRNSSQSVERQTLFLLPRVTQFQTKQEFYTYYEKYYQCEKPSAGDVWIVEPATVSKVEGGWQLKKKGVLDIREMPALREVTNLRPQSNKPRPLKSRTPIPLTKRSDSKNKTLMVGAAILALGLMFLAIVTWKLISGLRGTPSKSQSMASVAGASFAMGTKDGEENERPQHSVTVKPFSIDIYEVSREEYEAFIRATSHRSPSNWTNGQFTPNTGRWPVTGVDWYDADAYCKWIGKRLPTEEEWELAAKGLDARKYPWGNDWKSGYANADKASQGLTDVDKFKGTSPYGAIGMVGNAWEWTANKLVAYPGGRIPLQEIGDGKRDLRVIRGGSWQSDRSSATTTYRWGWPASGGKDYSNTGFRCVKDAQ